MLHCVHTQSLRNKRGSVFSRDSTVKLFQEKKVEETGVPNDIGRLVGCFSHHLPADIRVVSITLHYSPVLLGEIIAQLKLYLERNGKQFRLFN